MSENRPTLPVGDALRAVIKGGILRKILDFLRGWKFRAGPVNVQMSQKHGATPPRTGLDQPAPFNPPKVR